MCTKCSTKSLKELALFVFSVNAGKMWGVIGPCKHQA